jgi:hypothetical protein
MASGIARKNDARVKLYSRPGNDLTKLLSGLPGPANDALKRAYD